MGDALFQSEAAQFSANHQMRGRILQQLVKRHGIGAEIGVHKGHFTQTILQLTEPSQLHLIDPWYLFGQEWPWAKGNRSTTTALIGILQAFEAELVERRVILHIGHDLDILPGFPNDYFDWVYLDTSHQYEQTRRELAMLKLKVKGDGMITGDDWYTDPSHLHHGVCRAVCEFVAQEPYEVIYANEQDKQWAIRKTGR